MVRVRFGLWPQPWPQCGVDFLRFVVSKDLCGGGADTRNDSLLAGKVAEGVRHIERSRELDPTVVGPVPVELLALAEPPLLCRRWGELCKLLPLRMVETLTKLVNRTTLAAIVPSSSSLRKIPAMIVPAGGHAGRRRCGGARAGAAGSQRGRGQEGAAGGGKEARVMLAEGARPSIQLTAARGRRGRRRPPAQPTPLTPPRPRRSP